VIHHDGQVDVTVTLGPDTLWKGSRAFTAPLSQEALADLDWFWERHHSDVLGAHGIRGRAIHDLVPEHGAALWRSLFGDTWLEQQGSPRDITALTLESDDPAFLALPWELARKFPEETPAALNGTAIVRLLPAQGDAAADSPRPIRRILIAIARPADLFDPSVGCVAGPLATSLAGSGVAATLLSAATPERLTSMLSRAAREGAAYDLVHLDLHGASDESTSALSPLLLFETATGASMPVKLTDVLAWLADASVPALALSACRSIRPATYLPGRLKHIVGLSHELHPQAVSAFYGGFYQAVAAGLPVGEAVVRGRKNLAAAPAQHANSWPLILHLSTVPGDKRAPMALPDELSCAEPALGFMEADLWRTLELALHDRTPLNVFGLRGYGRSTLLDACAAWLDAFLVATAPLTLSGRALSSAELAAEISAYTQVCATTKRGSRRHAGAVLIDDLDGHLCTLDTDLGRSIADLSASGIAFGCSSILRRSELPYCYVQAPGVVRSGIADIDASVDGCPRLQSLIASTADAAELLDDPWSETGGSVSTRALRGLSAEAQELVAAMSEVCLVAGLLSGSGTIMAIHLATIYVQKSSQKAEADLDSAFDALNILSENVAAAQLRTSGGAATWLGCSALAHSGLLTFTEATTIRAHPLLLVAAARHISFEERSLGSARLDALANLFTARVFAAAAQDSDAPVRIETHVSCLLYCARRRLYDAALLMLLTLPSDFAYRNGVSFGRELRKNIARGIGGRPTPDQSAARWLWMHSFRSMPSQESYRIFCEEVAAVEAEIADGLRVESDMLDAFRSLQAAKEADAGHLRVAADIYRDLAERTSHIQTKRFALKGLAKISMSTGDPEGARSWLQQYGTLAGDDLPGRLAAIERDDLSILDSSVSVDLGDGWSSYDVLDARTAQLRHQATVDLREAGKRFHERGLAAISLGHLDEAERLLDEAVRLKGRTGDESLLVTSYSEQAKLALRRSDTANATRWLLSISDLNDIPVDTRLDAMTRLLVAADFQMTDAMGAAQHRTFGFVRAAVSESRSVDAIGLIDWVSALMNARAEQLSAAALNLMLDNRLGSDVTLAVARSFLNQVRTRLGETVPAPPPDVLATLAAAYEDDPTVQVQYAYSYSLAINAARFPVGTQPDSRTDPAVTERSRQALTSATIFCDLATTSGDFSLALGALRLAVNHKAAWHEGDWRSLLTLITRIPADNPAWASEEIAHIFFESVREVAQSPQELWDLVVSGLADHLASGAQTELLCSAFFTGVQDHLLGNTDFRWVPAVESTAAVCRVVANSALEAAGWYHAVQTLGELSYRHTDPVAPDLLGHIADTALTAFEERHDPGLGAPVAQCLMYHGIACALSDTDQAQARAAALRGLSKQGVSAALVAEYYLYLNLLPSLAAAFGRAESALGILKDYAARISVMAVRSLSEDLLKLIGKFVQALADLPQALTQLAAAHRLAIQTVESAAAPADRTSLIELGHPILWSTALRSQAMGTEPELRSECQASLAQWSADSPVAHAASASLTLTAILLGPGFATKDSAEATLDRFAAQADLAGHRQITLDYIGLACIILLQKYPAVLTTPRRVSLTHLTASLSRTAPEGSLQGQTAHQALEILSLLPHDM
jgi:hypothetical protein